VSSSRLASVVLLAVLVVSPALAQQSAPSRSWSEIPGGPGTMCGRGGPYNFYVHGESPRRFLIVLGGGGACWDAATCGDPKSFDATADLADIRLGAGLLDPKRLDNPLRGFSVVLVPYCTGDAHLGTRDATYGGDSTGAGGYVIHHSGRANARAALRWAFRMVPDPEILVVVGVDAGAIASPLVAQLIAEHYPKAKVVQLGDGAGGYRAPAIPEMMNTWGIPTFMAETNAYQNLDSARTTFETLYTGLKQQAPNLRMAQINSASDSTQLRLLGRMGVQGVPLAQLLYENLGEIHAARPGFRSYTAPGAKHTYLLSLDFYSVYSDSTSLRDWVAKLVSGQPVRDVGNQWLEKPPPPPPPPLAFGPSLPGAPGMADSLGTMPADSTGTPKPAGTATHADSLGTGVPAGAAEKAAPPDSASAASPVDSVGTAKRAEPLPK
jgi:hypothetical protein